MTRERRDPARPGLTRRRVLGSAATAAGVGLFAGPAGALALDRRTGDVFSRRVGRLAGESAVLTAGRRFVLAGVQWSAPAGARIELRARSRGGRWSRWALASVQGHGPDRPAAGGRFGEPLWFGPTDELQLRAPAPVDGVRVHLIAAAAVSGPLDGSPAGAPAADVRADLAGALPLAQPVLPAGPGQPPIIARSAWAPARDRPRAGPFFGSLQMAFVHHSDGPNGYSAAAVPALIQSIYLFHRYVRGWFDIGYNFMIDAFGRIWEARAGGVDEPVMGAQAGGYNQVSTGVCLLGSYEYLRPSPAAVDALERLLAWKLSLHGLAVAGRADVEVNPADAFYTHFRPGQHVRLPRIAGHRDGDMTSCPGDALYGELPAVRARARALAGTVAALELTTSLAPVAPGATITLSGRLAALGGPPLGGAPVELQTLSGAQPATTFATVTTAADGTWSTTLTAPHSLLIRALHRPAPAVVSGLVAVTVAPRLTLALASASPLRVTGTVTPAQRRVTLDVYHLAGAHRRLVLSRPVTARQGAFAARLALGRRARGSYEIVARVAAGSVSGAGASPPVTVHI